MASLGCAHLDLLVPPVVHDWVVGVVSSSFPELGHRLPVGHDARWCSFHYPYRRHVVLMGVFWLCVDPLGTLQLLKLLALWRLVELIQGDWLANHLVLEVRAWGLGDSRPRRYYNLRYFSFYRVTHIVSRLHAELTVYDGSAVVAGLLVGASPRDVWLVGVPPRLTLVNNEISVFAYGLVVAIAASWLVFDINFLELMAWVLNALLV